MLPPATRPQDVPTPPIPAAVAQPAEAARIRSDGQPQGPAAGAGGTAEGAPAARPAAARADAESGADAALASEHERALGRGRLIDVLG